LYWISPSKSDILYFHSYSYFPPPYFSFATYPYTSSTSTSNGSCFCCCNQCSSCILVARNSTVSSAASNPAVSPANLSAYHPPYHYHPRLPSGGPTTTAVSTVNRYHNRNSASNISTIPAAAVTAAAASNSYNHNHQYQHFLQQNSRFASSGNSSSHVYGNLNSLVVVGDETNIASTLSPTSSTVTTATTTPIKRAQDEVEDVQMVSIACLACMTPTVYFLLKTVSSGCVYLIGSPRCLVGGNPSVLDSP
jgi:hypothetical protein